MKGEIASLNRSLPGTQRMSRQEEPFAVLPLSSIVDLAKYPVHARGSAALAEVTEEAGRRYLTEGIVTFPGFLLPEAVDLAVADIEMDTDKAWQELVQKCGLLSLDQLILLFEAKLRSVLR